MTDNAKYGAARMPIMCAGCRHPITLCACSGEAMRPVPGTFTNATIVKREITPDGYYRVTALPEPLDRDAYGKEWRWSVAMMVIITILFALCGCVRDDPRSRAIDACQRSTSTIEEHRCFE